MKRIIVAIIVLSVSVFFLGCSLSSTIIKKGPNNKVISSEYSRKTFSIFGDKESARSWSQADRLARTPSKTGSKRKPRIGSTGHIGPVRNRK